MAGHTPFSVLRNKMTPQSRAASKAMASTMLVEMELKELRKHSGMPQKEFAALLGVSQPNLSQLESRRDMQINTLKNIIEKLGGELDIIAHFPDGDVRLTQFSNAE